MTRQEIVGLIPADFPDHSRVWVYQSSRPFSEREKREIDEQLYQFYAQWQAHGAQVKGWAALLFNRFVVMMADESVVDVSGCSMDSAARIVKSLERQYEVNLFDRLSLTFLVKGKPEVLPLHQVQYAIDQGFIDAGTPMFNNLVDNKADLLEKWLLPLRESWLAARLSFPVKK